MRLLGWILSSLVFLAVAGGVAGFMALQHFSKDLPDYTQLADYAPPITTRLHAGDGRLMAEYAVENRLFVPIEPRKAPIARDQPVEPQGFDHRGPGCQGTAPGAALLGAVGIAQAGAEHGRTRRAPGGLEEPRYGPGRQQAVGIDEQ